MKYTLTTILTLVYFTVNAQLVSCPLTVSVERDTVTEAWGLQTSGQTPYILVGNFKPVSNSKEGYIYTDWNPLDSKLTTAQELNIVYLAQQNRFNQQAGTIEISSYYCVYGFKSKLRKK